MIGKSKYIITFTPNGHVVFRKLIKHIFPKTVYYKPLGRDITPVKQGWFEECFKDYRYKDGKCQFLGFSTGPIS